MLVDNASCESDIGDIGPYYLSKRAKSYAIGCLSRMGSDSSGSANYGPNYCAFWNCRVKEPGEGTSQECTTPKYTSYLLKSKARVADSGTNGCVSNPEEVSICVNAGGAWDNLRCVCLNFGGIGGSTGSGCNSSCPSGQHLVKNSTGCCCEYDSCGQHLGGQNVGACKCYSDSTTNPNPGTSGNLKA